MPVALQVDADVIAATVGRAGRGRAVDQRAAEVLLLEHAAELRGTPVLDEELQAGLSAQAAVAVVAEDRDDALPDVGDLVEGHPGAEPDGEMRVRGQSAAHPQVEAGSVIGVHDADEGDVVDLVRDVEPWASR